MNAFSYFAPTEIIFGRGSAAQAGALCKKYGTRALLVTGSSTYSVYHTIAAALEQAGIAYSRFDGVIPNPTPEVVTAGAAAARAFGAKVIIGIGGGSAMDSAKAIAVEASHPGTAWDYLHYTAGPTEKTLPVLCIGTTAGTGAQVTPCAVITHTEKKDKSAIWHRNIFPRAAIVDPDATDSMPTSVTAQTGFDAFCHCFEAYLSAGTNPLAEALALDGIRRAAEFLPCAVQDGSDKAAREQMAWADTLGGLSIASGGVTLPHGLGMQVGGHCPHVSHGQALAAIYPTFTRYTYASAVQKFATVGRIFNSTLASVPDKTAAAVCCEEIDMFLKRIGLWIGFADLGVTQEDLRAIADCGQVLGDYKNNPRIASIGEMYEMLMESWRR
jgi:alcohol dehydrogenase class IV